VVDVLPWITDHIKALVVVVGVPGENINRQSEARFIYVSCCAQGGSFFCGSKAPDPLQMHICVYVGHDRGGIIGVGCWLLEKSISSFGFLLYGVAGWRGNFLRQNS
jgi:hypothetical protein